MGRLVHAYKPSVWSLRQENHKFKDNMGFRVKPSRKTKEKSYEQQIADLSVSGAVRNAAGLGLQQG